MKRKSLIVLSSEEFAGKFSVPNNPALARVETMSPKELDEVMREPGQEAGRIELRELEKFYQGLYRL